MNIIPNSEYLFPNYDDYHNKWNVNSGSNLEYRLSIDEAQTTV